MMSEQKNNDANETGMNDEEMVEVPAERLFGTPAEAVEAEDRRTARGCG